MHRLYKSITAALAFAGCMSLVITGEMNPIFLVPGLAIIPGYIRYLRDKPPMSRWLVAGLALVEMVVLGFDLLVISEDYLVAIAHMTIIFQALKSYDFQSPWDPLQVYFMSLLQLIITSELSLSIAVGGVFVGFLLVFMSALIISHFMNEGSLGKVGIRRPVALISLVALCMTAVFFVTVPRVSGGLWGRKASHGIKTVGFSDSVNFGSFGEMLDNDTIVMRAELSGPRLPLYWRGVTLDYFDGNSWSSTYKYNIFLNKRDGWFDMRQGFPSQTSASGQEQALEQRIILEPMDNNVLFGIDSVAAISMRGYGVTRDTADSAYMIDKADRRISYTVRSMSSEQWHPVLRSLKVDYMQLPDAGMKRIGELARSITANLDTDLARASAIERYLSTTYKYSLTTTRPAEGVSAMEYFLFEERQGYCEHFASAMVLMLRSVGIPARIVNGFYGGEENEYGGYVIVRQRNAHSWVEAAIDGYWERFDPTPPVPSGLSSFFGSAADAIRMGWYRYIIGFSYSDQVLMVQSLSVPMIDMPSIKGIRVTIKPYYLLIVAAVGFALWFMLSARKSLVRKGPTSKAYMRVRSRVASMRDARINESSTPHEVLAEARRLAGELPATERFIRSYESARFGGGGSDGLSSEADESIKELSSVGRS